MSKTKNGGLGQYGAEPFEQQQFETAGTERVKVTVTSLAMCRPCKLTPEKQTDIARHTKQF